MFKTILNSSAINIHIFLFHFSMDLSLLFPGNNFGVEFLGSPRQREFSEKCKGNYRV